MQSSFSWGSTDKGQLGISNLHEYCTVPTKISKFSSSDIIKVSCGRNHTFFLLKNGKVYGCGANKHKKMNDVEGSTAPAQIHMLDSHKIIDISAGYEHSAAVTSDGKLFTWGRNTFFELGRDTISDNSLKLVSALSYIQIVQVSCGSDHTIALSKTSNVYTWGCNDCGQLGIPNSSSNQTNYSSPKRIESVYLMPIKQIIAAEKFSIILTISGQIYSFGSNSYGQLGHENAKYDVPQLIKHIRKQPIAYVSVGQNHVAALSMDGGVFTWGYGRFGQLGHSSFENVSTPTKVFDLMGSCVTQVECGMNHTLAFVQSTGIVYGFGQGSLGQLGCGDLLDRLHTPGPIKGPWVPVKLEPNRINRQLSLGDTPPHIVQRIYAGGDMSIMTAFDEASCSLSTESSPSRSIDVKCEVVDLRRWQWTDACQIATVNCEDETDLIACQHALTRLQSINHILFSSLPCIASSFLILSFSNHVSISYHGLNLDLTAHIMNQFLTSLSIDRRRELSNDINNKILSQLAFPNAVNYPTLESVRFFLFLFVSTLFEFEECLNVLLFPFTKAFLSIPRLPMTVMESWLGKFKPRHFKKVITVCVSYVSKSIADLGAKYRLENTSKLGHLKPILDFLKIMDKINESNHRIVHYNTFYIPDILSAFDLEKAYDKYLSNSNGNGSEKSTFSIFNYPFLFDGIAKARMLKTEATCMMRSNHLIFNFFGLRHEMVGPQPSFHITVRRNNILGDTLSQLQQATQVQLKKPFRVNFFGEDALDEGGVMKELFLLTVPEILNQNYGLFQEDPESRLWWFHNMIFDENLQDIDSVGRFFGLAIYNNVMIDLRFPLAMFKKLLNEKITLDDLLELRPTLGRSLQSLLDYDEPDFDENFGLDFVITIEAYGKLQEIELVPNGRYKNVTLENRSEYVDLYVDYLLNKNVAAPFNKFHEGFLFTMQGECYKFFKPIELQDAMVGSENFDWNQLRESCTYLGEYWPKHPIIEWFWAVFFELSAEDKKKFLRFLTGCDRVPVQGMSDIKIKIQPVNAGDKHLPVAHTCYNLLDLPKYSSKKVMQDKLMISISNYEGFALV